MLSTITGRILLIIALLIVLGLQYDYWFGENGVFQHRQLLEQTNKQQELNREYKERNRALAAEVYDLKNGWEAVEEYARLDLGLVKSNETFVQMSMISKDYKPIYMNDMKVTEKDKYTNEYKGDD